MISSTNLDNDLRIIAGGTPVVFPSAHNKDSDVLGLSKPKFLGTNPCCNNLLRASNIFFVTLPLDN